MWSNFLQAIINTWLLLTGRRVELQKHPWLHGPMSNTSIIGDRFYAQYAEQAGLELDQNPPMGLLEKFDEVLMKEDPLSAKLNPRIARFYENTSEYQLEVWSQWSGPVQYFAKILIRGLSRKMQQMNIPLNPLESSHGMSSSIIALIDDTGKRNTACWLRKSVKSGSVVYAGFYSATWLPQMNNNCVKVVFPLPKGNVTVLLKVLVQEDGSVKLVSYGKKIGDPGYYRLRSISGKKDLAAVKYIPLKEVIHVYEDEQGVLRTDHQFFFMGSKFLDLHYKIIEKPAP